MLSFSKLATPMLQAAPSWVRMLFETEGQARGGERTGMPFWLVAVLWTILALVVVWGLYLMARRWM